MPEREELLAVARAVAAGLPVDWATVESSAGDDSLRAAIRELKIIAGIAELHHSLPGTSLSSPLSSTDERAGAEPSGAAPDARPAPAAAQTWGPLALIERVGRGSFGDVYRAHDSRLDREVALKLLRHRADTQGSAGSTVVEEGRLLARVRHPNIVAVYGADRIDGRIGVWMEFVHGRTLGQIVREHGPLDGAEAARIGIELCHALAAVHRAGLVHRDVKAQNVMREVGGRTVLMDFGAGRDAPAGHVEDEDRFAGTPLYLAPELFRGATADTRTDVYSLGVLLYHLVTGSYPVRAGTLREVREAHRLGERRRLRAERPELAEALVEAIERALEPDPMRRFESADAMADALSRAAGWAGVSAPAENAVQEDGSRPADATPAARATDRRRGLLLAAGVATVLVAFAVLGIGGWRDRLFGGAVPPGRSAGLSGLRGLGAPSLVVRRIATPDSPYPVRPSLDGRFLSFVDRNGSLAIAEVESGTFRVLIEKHRPAEFAYGTSAISPDSQWVAYTWATSDGTSEMRVVSTGGGSPRTLLRHRGGEVYPIEWSHDGTQILAVGPRRGGAVQIALVGAADRAVKVLKESAWRPMGVSVSPDARFVVYDRPQQDNPRIRDIVMLAADGSGEWPVVQHPANDLFPQWTADGERVIFASDRAGAQGLWAVRVNGGYAAGEPEVLSRDMGRMLPLGVTRDGVFYYFLKTDLVDVYTVAVDPATGEVRGKPQPVAPDRIGSNISSDWSPDGRSLAYVSIRGAVPVDRFSRTLTIRDMDTGTERDLWPALAFFISPRWSPDGRTILVSGLDLQQRSGIHQVDVGTGRVTPGIVGVRQLGDFEWSADGRAIQYRKGAEAIMSHDLVTGADTMLLDFRAAGIDRLTPRMQPPPPQMLTTFQVSPDGQWLAASAWTGDGPRSTASLQLLSLGGGERRLLHVAKRLALHGWTSAGDLLFSEPAKDESDRPPVRLWRISASGGEPRDMGIEMRGLSEVRVTADGTRLTFTAGFDGGEIRAMENFLPR